MRIIVKLLTGILIVATLVACGTTDPEGTNFLVEVYDEAGEEGYFLAFLDPGDRALLRASTKDKGSEQRINRTGDAVWTVTTMDEDATYDASEVVRLEAFDEATGFRPLRALGIPDGEETGDIKICAVYEHFAEDCIAIIVGSFADN